MACAGLLIVVSCCLATVVFAASVPGPGGISNVDDLSSIPAEVINKGKQHLAVNGPCLQSYTLVSATSQVVNGKKFILTFNADMSQCENGYGSQVCTVSIWFQQWLNSIDVKEPKCKAV